MKRYLSLNDYLKFKFGEKVAKLSLDGGFTCPNRDGTISERGCIFCTDSGSGEFTGDIIHRSMDIKLQIQTQKCLMRKKWKVNKFISYFQNFTGTYGEIKRLETLYYSALDDKEIVGLAVATRADCLSDDILSLLKEISKTTFLWLELGMQTTNEETLHLINRGYSHNYFDTMVKKLKEYDINFVPHVIFGLPFETKDDMLDSINYVATLQPFGVKIHSLYIDTKSDLYHYYLKHPFPLLSKEDYVSLVADAIELLPKNIVLHRLTGDPDSKTLFKPLWAKNKLAVLSSIEHELKRRKLPLLDVSKLMKEKNYEFF